jgi:hypothetical protein
VAALSTRIEELNRQDAKSAKVGERKRRGEERNELKFLYFHKIIKYFLRISSSSSLHSLGELGVLAVQFFDSFPIESDVSHASS